MMNRTEDCQPEVWVLERWDIHERTTSSTEGKVVDEVGQEELQIG
jgi:hypothetical protein